MELEPQYTKENAINSCVFQGPPDASFGYRDQEEEKLTKEEEIEEDKDSSSEDEDMDHSEHFFQLAKKQVSLFKQ
jgi:hypothetical protein